MLINRELLYKNVKSASQVDTDEKATKRKAFRRREDAYKKHGRNQLIGGVLGGIAGGGVSMATIAALASNGLIPNTEQAKSAIVAGSGLTGLASATLGARLAERLGNYIGKDTEAYRKIPSQPILSLPSLVANSQYKSHPYIDAAMKREKALKAKLKGLNRKSPEAAKLIEQATSEDRKAEREYMEQWNDAYGSKTAGMDREQLKNIISNAFVIGAIPVGGAITGAVVSQIPGLRDPKASRKTNAIRGGLAGGAISTYMLARALYKENSRQNRADELNAARIRNQEALMRPE